MDVDRQFNGWMSEWSEEDEWIESWMECALYSCRLERHSSLLRVVDTDTGVINLTG